MPSETEASRALAERRRRVPASQAARFASYAGRALPPVRARLLGVCVPRPSVHHGPRGPPMYKDRELPHGEDFC